MKGVKGGSDLSENTMFVIILFILSLPFYFIYAVLAFISISFRCIIRILITLKTGKKTEIMGGADPVYFLATSKSKLRILSAAIFEGKLDFDRNLNLLNAKLKSNLHNYGKFFKFPKECCGYFYWQEEENFNIKDHVLLHKCKPPSSDKELSQILTDVVNSELEIPGKSQWKMLFFPLADDYEEFSTAQSRYVFALLVHHSLTDGIGIVKFISEIFLETKPIPQSTTRNFIQKFTECLEIIVYIPTFFYKRTLIKDKNILHRIPQIGERTLCFSSAVTLDRLKKIKNLTGTTVNDITVSCIVAAVEKHFGYENEPLPDKIHCMIPVSTRKPEHPTFSNEVTGGNFQLPLNCATPLDRLAATCKQTKMLKKSYEYKCLDYLQRFLFNTFPSYLLGPICQDFLVSFVISNIPGPQCLNCTNDKVAAIMTFPPHGANVGFALVITGCNDEISFTISSDKTIFQDYETLRRLLDDCIKEVDLLESSITG